MAILITPATNRYRNQATQRVLGFLSLFTGAQETRGVSEISRATGTNKNMVHRILSTLVEAGYLVRDPSGERYQLGYRILDLHMNDEDPDITMICKPALEQLHALTGESIFLSIIVGNNRVNVDWIEAPGRRVSFGIRGRSVPLHNSVMSRLLLANLSDEEVANYLAVIEPLSQSDEQSPDGTPTIAESIWNDVRSMRGKSLVKWRSHRQFGGAYAAFPIPGADRRLHGIVTIGGPIERFNPDEAAARLDVLAVIDVLRERCKNLIPSPTVTGDRLAA